MSTATQKSQQLAAIDVSQATLVVAVHGAAETFTFDNDGEGHKKLLRFLKKRRVSGVVLEPTGNYGLDVMVALHHAEITVHPVNPKAARSFAKASMRRAKTDHVDAHVLLSFGQRMELDVWTPPRPAVLQLHLISRRLEQVVKMTAAEKAREKGLCETTALPVLTDSLHTLRDALENEQERLVSAAVGIAKADEELSQQLGLLVSVRGVAERTAIKVLGEIALWPADLTTKQAVAMVGLDPRPVDSGNFLAQRKISKQGNAHLRASLYMAAHNAVLYEPAVTRFYDELIAKGKHRKTALVAVMRKLLHAFMGMLASKTAFEPERFRATPAMQLSA